MWTLNGAMDGIGLAPLVSFLTTLKKTGHLTLSEGVWSGTIRFSDGVVVGATFEHDHGLAAIESLVLALGRGHFTFSEDPDNSLGIELNVALRPSELQARLVELDREAAELASVVPSLGAVARVAPTEWGSDDEIILNRSTLTLYGSLDGGRRIDDLARERSVTRVLRDIVQLVRLGLVTIDVPLEHAFQALPEPTRALPDPDSSARERWPWRKRPSARRAS